MSYTAADQRADTAFLVGVTHGRDTERARITAALAAALDAHKPGEDGHCTCGEDLFGLTTEEPA